MRARNLIQLLEFMTLKDWESKISDVTFEFEIRIDNDTSYRVSPDADYHRLAVDFNNFSDREFLIEWKDELNITQEKINSLDFDSDGNLEPYPRLIEFYTIVFIDESESYFEFYYQDSQVNNSDYSATNSLAQKFNNDTERSDLNWNTNDLKQLIREKELNRKSLPKEFKPLTKKIDLD